MLARIKSQLLLTSRGGLEPEWKEREGKLGNSDGEDKDERDSLKVKEENI